jgi:hypothetical protein
MPHTPFPCNSGLQPVTQPAINLGREGQLRVKRVVAAMAGFGVFIAVIMLLSINKNRAAFAALFLLLC